MSKPGQSRNSGYSESKILFCYFIAVSKAKKYLNKILSMLKSDHHQKIKNHEIRKKSLELVFKSTRYVRLETPV